MDVGALVDIVKRRRAENQRLLQAHREDPGYYSNLLYEDDIILDLFEDAGVTIMISLEEWAYENGIDYSAAERMAVDGTLKTAAIEGRNWMVNRSEILQ